MEWWKFRRSVLESLTGQNVIQARQRPGVILNPGLTVVMHDDKPWKCSAHARRKSAPYTVRSDKKPLGSRTRTTTSTRFSTESIFRVFQKNRHPTKLHCIFSTSKVSTVIFTEAGLIPLPIAEWLNFEHLITCFCHYDILTKTRSRLYYELMMTAIKFSRQNDTDSRARTT